ncbi:hypothetical protein [Streptomyces sp. E-08]
MLAATGHTTPTGGGQRLPAYAGSHHERLADVAEALVRRRLTRDEVLP